MIEIIKAAQKVYGVEPHARNRSRKHVWARFAVCAVLRNTQSSSSIGQLLERDHATVLNAFKQHELQMRYKDYSEKFMIFMEEINKGPAGNAMRMTNEKAKVINQILRMDNEQFQQFKSLIQQIPTSQC
jgi:hypothetical protein